jgi:3-(3-hydroxy-phenyl)propionate hydroxylase
MDDCLGDGACLISRASVGATAAGVRLLELDTEELAPFRPALLGWLDQHAAEAVLVRPDRYVFGTGAARVLLDAWAESLGLNAPALVAAQE